jgi:cell wall-associated NlpC family hydrolase
VLVPLRAYADPTPADIDRDMAAASQRLETVVEQYNTAQENLRATQAQLSALDVELAPLAAQLDGLAQQVARIATSAYKTAGAGPLSSLLSAGSPATFLDQLTMLDHISREQARDLAALKQARARYDSRHAELIELAGHQNEQQAQLATTKATIEAELASLQQLRAKSAATRVARSAPRDTYVPAYSGGASGVAVNFAYRQLGKEYRWGGEGPDEYDCSGLVLASWRAAGVSLPHSSSMQWNAVHHIGRDQLRPGDLVFYYSDIHHVALYIGDGRMIHAPQEGERVSIRGIDYQSIYGYGRV